METPPKPLLKSITLEGFLSFGFGAQEIPLTALNVIIGPNGSGKSNLVEALSVLRAVPRDLPLPIRKGGGVKDWLWKGGGSGAGDVNGSGSGAGIAYGTGFSNGSGAGQTAARIEIILAEGHIARFQGGGPAVRYRLVFGAKGDSLVVLDERIENVETLPGKPKPIFYFGYENGRPMLNVKGEDKPRHLRREDIDPTQSILSQRKDPDTYPELTRLSEVLGQIRIYRSWQFGPDVALRMACRPDVRTDYLSEDFDNLPARLAVLKRTPAVKRRLIELIRELDPNFEDLEVIPEGGALQLYVMENGRSVPARRLSDGTLRYLCLLAILIDPGPAPLIAIEEPELGLHPDILPQLATLLREASARTQLVVTTHSDVLVDALTDTPESILVCEKSDGSTRLLRLDAARLKPWLEKYHLGELWTRGEIGGTRW